MANRLSCRVSLRQATTTSSSSPHLPKRQKPSVACLLGSAFRSRRYARTLRLLHITHKRTRPYTPKTNGKAERFVQTSLREWAYAKAYETSEQRRSELGVFLFNYNWKRPHMSLNAKPPVSRLGLSEDNLLRLHS